MSEQELMEQAMNGIDEFGDEGAMGPPQTEEHVFFATLSKENRIFKFEGCDDAESSLILRRATLDADCTDESRHVIQVITLDHQDNRVTGTLCSLKLNGGCTVSLDGVSVAPPTAFKLLKGDGPISICGNLMKEVDPELMPDMDGDSEEESEDNEADIEEVESEESEEEISAEDVSAKVAELKRKSSGDAEVSVAKKTKPAPKSPEKVVAAKIESVDNTINKKTGLKHKVYKDVDELVKAVLAHKGGRPKKQEKFENWIKHTFKVDDKKMASAAWALSNK
jgi:hypothetical protein